MTYDDGEKKKLEEPNAEFEPLTKLMKKDLGDKTVNVVVSSRLADSEDDKKRKFEELRLSSRDVQLNRLGQTNLFASGADIPFLQLLAKLMKEPHHFH